MDQQRARIQEDLRGLLAGQVRCDDVFLQLYSSDASIYQIRPLGVVMPRNTADVSAAVRYAKENNLPIHARGAGTGLAGESLGPGLVIDFSRHLRRVIQCDGESVRVQPGVVHERLNAHLARFGRHFGPDPAMSGVTTMGSVLALDASGSHWLRYGSARRHVQSLQVVLDDGQVMEVGQESLALLQPADTGGTGAIDRRHDLVGRLAELLSREAATIQRHQPKSLVNRCGYHLDGVLTSTHLDLARMIVGSEGTLALITEATLATQPLPRHRGLAVLLFDRLDSALRAVQEIVPMGPSACDLMDRRHLSLAREADSRYDPLIPPATEALLLVEYDGDDPAEVRSRVQLVSDRIRRRRRLAFDSRQVFEAAELELYWLLARKVVSTLHRVKGNTRPLPLVEDMAVPPAALPSFMVEMQNILKRHQVTASLFGHVGHGQLHLRPFVDLADTAEVHKMQELAGELYQAVFAVGGTISGEHAAGLSRTQFLAQQYGELYDVFREVKRIFDPQNVFNPGKVIGDDPQLMLKNLRPSGEPPQVEPSDNGEAERRRSVVELQLAWSPSEMAEMARSCNGCGNCRVQSADARMCPVFRFAPAEEASPRAKANLMRGILSGEIEASTLASDEFKAVADLCVNCHQCRLECPSNVDIPKLMLEAKAEYVASNGLRFGDWLLTHLDLVGSVGNLVSPLVNWAIANRWMRWLIEKLFGIAQGRKLPRFAPRSFIRRAGRRRLTRPTRRSGRKVLFFVDVYANYHDTQLAEALVAVMEHNGVAVYVHPGQWSSGMSMLTLGAVDRVRTVAEHNIALLAEAVRQGYHIVTIEPAAALCLTREYLSLVNDDDAQLVAQNTSEACTYLWKLHTAGALQLDFKPINATLGYHLPCHLRALEVGTPGMNLLKLIPGLSLQRMERGCSGMAGTFGLKQANYRASLRAGWELISSIRDGNVQAGTTECSSCKMQMEQGSSKPTIHPLKLLALAYGLLPESQSPLNLQSEELIVT
jgi:FAD/FMN-containing dehydrogenase/Fe-S oxidoreductase